MIPILFGGPLNISIFLSCLVVHDCTTPRNTGRQVILLGLSGVHPPGTPVGWQGFKIEANATHGGDGVEETEGRNDE